MELEKKIFDYFALLKEKSILGSSYIFIGNNFSLVNCLLMLINCGQERYQCGQCWSCKRIKEGNHPDLLVVEPEGISIKIEAIRSGVRFLSLRSYSSPKKILIIKEADKLTQESANLFLKTLEEPPKDSFIGLFVPKLEDILPTLISRCRKIYLPYQSSSQAEPESGLLKDGLKQLDSLRRKIPDVKNRKDFSLLLESLVVSLHSQLKKVSTEDPRQALINYQSDLNSLQLVEAIEDLFQIYRARATVNINLALNIIQMRLR